MIIYGINPVLEALQSKDSPPDRIWITRGKSNPRLQQIIEMARGQDIPVRFESARVVANKASTPHHQEIVAEIASIGYVVRWCRGGRGAADNPGHGVPCSPPTMASRGNNADKVLALVTAAAVGLSVDAIKGAGVMTMRSRGLGDGEAAKIGC